MALIMPAGVKASGNDFDGDAQVQQLAQQVNTYLQDAENAACPQDKQCYHAYADYVRCMLAAARAGASPACTPPNCRPGNCNSVNSSVPSAPTGAAQGQAGVYDPSSQSPPANSGNEGQGFQNSDDESNSESGSAQGIMADQLNQDFPDLDTDGNPISVTDTAGPDQGGKGSDVPDYTPTPVDADGDPSPIADMAPLGNDDPAQAPGYPLPLVLPCCSSPAELENLSSGDQLATFNSWTSEQQDEFLADVQTQQNNFENAAAKAEDMADAMSVEQPTGSVLTAARDGATEIVDDLIREGAKQQADPLIEQMGNAALGLPSGLGGQIAGSVGTIMGFQKAGTDLYNAQDGVTQLKALSDLCLQIGTAASALDRYAVEELGAVPALGETGVTTAFLTGSTATTVGVVPVALGAATVVAYGTETINISAAVIGVEMDNGVVITTNQQNSNIAQIYRADQANFLQKAGRLGTLYSNLSQGRSQQNETGAVNP